MSQDAIAGYFFMGKDITKFHDISVDLDYEKIIKKYGKKTVNRLKAVSPKSGRRRPTPYSEGWEAEERTYRHGDRTLIWNKTNWQLTHLLENGHFITTKINGVGYSASIPHIRPTFREIAPKFVREMRKTKSTVKLK